MGKLLPRLNTLVLEECCCQLVGDVNVKCSYLSFFLSLHAMSLPSPVRALRACIRTNVRPPVIFKSPISKSPLPLLSAPCPPTTERIEQRPQGPVVCHTHALTHALPPYLVVCPTPPSPLPVMSRQGRMLACFILDVSNCLLFPLCIISRPFFRLWFELGICLMLPGLTLLARVPFACPRSVYLSNMCDCLSVGWLVGWLTAPFRLVSSGYCGLGESAPHPHLPCPISSTDSTQSLHSPTLPRAYRCMPIQPPTLNQSIN
ncbi:hypothetical protein DM02DRAFT_357417 [Periconia macrospinosa]|uniref:Uncharacterized protein n=1 Tax=Periconia macrospinosa TaxID=97972 RepID=A0A2V1EB34_9PLEO|nr:hypothetical protein DM02DRAFT_357417 [Periconia macrospinosa]